MNKFTWEFHPLFMSPIIIYYCIYIPVLLYYLRSYVKYVDVVYISKRHPLVSIIEISSVLLAIAINFTLVTIYRTMGPSNQPMYNILYNVSIFLQPITVYGSFYGLLWRWLGLLFHVSFNLNLSLCLI